MCVYGPETVSVVIEYQCNNILIVKESMKNPLDVLKSIGKDDFKITANKTIKSFK